MGKYGIPYMGSKSKIAEDIIAELPRGKRFVDLFGGGFAMTHCAMLSGKYEQFYYADFNPLLPPLIEKAINGYYNYDNFTPEFITREEFYKLKEKDGYIKYIWSFGNDGQSYLFGEDVEPIKHKVHDYCVFCKPFDDFEVVGKTITERRFYLKREVKRRLNQRLRIEQLERLQQLERLERLQHLQQLEIKCADYRDYTHKDGDVVYCDIPYEGTKDYGDTFDHKEFYDWADSRPYNLYFSSYDISDNRFRAVWEKKVLSTLSATSNSTIKIEKLYFHGDKHQNEQLSFF